MSERKSSAYIGDILSCIKHIGNYTGNLSFDEFDSFPIFTSYSFAMHICHRVMLAN